MLCSGLLRREIASCQRPLSFSAGAPLHAGGGLQPAAVETPRESRAAVQVPLLLSSKCPRFPSRVKILFSSLAITQTAVVNW